MQSVLSAWAKHLVEASCRRASRDVRVAESVWQESLGQCAKGWLREVRSLGVKLIRSIVGPGSHPSDLVSFKARRSDRWTT